MKLNIHKIAALLLLFTTAVVAQQCKDDWILRGESCYKWFNESQYWFDAEQICRSHQGHLVSIHSQHENTLVARLAQCSDVWIGRFCMDLRYPTSASSYAWSDGSNPDKYNNHYFQQKDTVHKLVIRSNGGRWLNSLYQDRNPFVCERGFIQGNTTLRCPNGWSLYQNHCYLMPDFESNFNEANFYCQRKSSQLVSVLNEAELNNIKKLVFGIDGCGQNPIDTVWLGLIKLNPCFPDSGGRELCYQWTDFSGKHLGFPIWQFGHPNNSDWTVNCVTLRGDRLFSEQCYNRHRFVCKSAARNDTDGGGSGSVDGVVAAFDFRKGLDNLVNPNTYIVRDDFRVSRTYESGACFLYKQYYRFGNATYFNESFLSNPQWTLFVRASFHQVSQDSSGTILSVSDDDTISSGLQPPFYVQMRGNYMDTSLYTYEHQFQPRNGTTMVYYNEESFRNTLCHASTCFYAIAANNSRSIFVVHDRSSQAYYSQYSRMYSWPHQTNIFLGKIHYSSYPSSLCISCFGIVNRQLNSTELNMVLKTFCPSDN